jgi:hypothetical protein
MPAPAVGRGKPRPPWDNYKAMVAAAVSLGGEVVVAFALVWILVKVTHSRINVDITISLPLIVIVGVTLLLIVIALVAFTFSRIGLTSAGEALGLPDGSVRAIIALMLLVIFSIMSIFLYDSIATREPQTLSHVSQTGLNDMRSHVMVIRQEPEEQAGGATTDKTFIVTYRELNGPADDIAKQLIVMLGTLVTAVASLYFGSASVASASAAVSGLKPGGPVATSISPSPIQATGVDQPLIIVGTNLNGVTELHLEQKGQPDIDATDLKAAATSVIAQINIPRGKTGTWQVVVDDRSLAVTLHPIEIGPQTTSADAPAVTVPEPSKEETQPGSDNGVAAAQVDVKTDASKLAQAETILPPTIVPATINRAFLGHGIFSNSPRSTPCGATRHTREPIRRTRPPRRLSTGSSRP